MMKPRIDVFCHKWHLNQSPAFDDMLISPLSEVASIETKAIDDTAVNWLRVGLDRPAVFCQWLPPREVLVDSRRRLVWLPMWDSVWFYSSSWWARLPRHLRIIVFSDAIAEKVVNISANTCKVKYFKNPSMFERVNNTFSTMFYWNRTNMFAASSLCAICRHACVDKLILLDVPDPGYMRYDQQELVAISRNVRLELHQRFMSRPEYFHVSEEATLLLSPRLREGVGMAFLEALARGNGVVAVDGATMNEYIVDGFNGRLIPGNAIKLRKMTHIAFTLEAICRSIPRLRWRAEAFLLGQASRPDIPLRGDTDWSFLADTDWARIGRKAKESHCCGFVSWTQDIDRLRDFVLNW